MSCDLVLTFSYSALITLWRSGYLSSCATDGHFFIKQQDQLTEFDLKLVVVGSQAILGLSEFTIKLHHG